MNAITTAGPHVDALVKAAREVCAGTEPQMQASDDYHWVEFIEPRLERLRSALQPFLEKKPEVKNG